MEKCKIKCGIIDGINYGKCPYNQCCGQNGYCGATSDYCSTSEGCQSEFGQCNEIRCGEGISSCPKGQFCNVKGYCDTIIGYCSYTRSQESIMNELSKLNQNTEQSIECKYINSIFNKDESYNCCNEGSILCSDGHIIEM